MAKTTDSTAPAISIIIPVYNAEKYIGEALDSILIQTLTSFEVIVVDDCSTDSSYKVVESYIPKFDGRLKLLQMDKNSGCAPAPRNKGFLISRGEYIFFMDSDDVFTETALEEMYGLAKEYDADVVYCEKYFMSTGVGKEFVRNVHPADGSIQIGGFVDKPTFISDNLADRLEELFQRKFWVTPWQRLVSRKLLADNNINFPVIIGSDDVVWCLAVLCFAKKFLRVPNSCYIRRMYDESFTKSSKKSPNRHIHQWMDITIRGLQFVNNFMDKLDFFRDNPEYRYKVFQHLSTRHSFNVIYPVCKELPINQVYEIFLNEFAKDNGEQNLLISYLCTRMFICDDESRESQRKIKSLNEASQKDKQRIVELEDEIKYLINEVSRLKKEQSNLTEIPSLLQINYDDLVMPAPPPVNVVKPNSCAVSVVVPMYNAEEYIRDCLDSLLIQTFTDFEVIVADDCSTDDSVKIVEEYAPKFNGRLQLTRTKKNSGGGGYIPRNLGLSLASGEYVIFLDADDFLLGSALETLYNAAKEHDAEVVYSSSYYNLKQPNDIYLQRDGLGRKWAREGIEDKTNLTVDDRHKIFQQFVTPGSGEGNFRHPWSKFVRRDYLLKNDIHFPDIITGGDCVWCINVYAYANRFLRLPTPLYFYRRYNATSLTRATRVPSEQLSYWVEAFVAFLRALNDLQNKTEFLRENPYYCYEATRGGHFEWCLNRTNEARGSMNNPEVYETLYHEFNKAAYISDATVPFFFSVIDNDRKLSSDNAKLLNRLKPYITARLDIEFLSELAEGDLQILNVSDNQSSVVKPSWFQKDGTAYVIHSYAGKIEIFAKATSNGQFTLKLKGVDVRDNKDKSKRIPYWIDYTRLTINDKKIFGSLKSAWHDKPYRYTVKLPAFQEIIIKVEWLPHRSNT
ncbi:MAG: glycosyltransferase [Selenomonadaceae bacterium]|nr:glycosyltransferase [Selenomonadaceae bacterium]